MNKFIITVAILGALLMAEGADMADEAEPSYSETIVSEQVEPDVAGEEGDADVTAFDAYSLFYYGTAKAQCYRCSRPCSNYACCRGTYPQCCRVSGRCRCCRR